jgi:hypothetical protein
MTSLFSAISTFRNGVRAFFKADVRLQRAEGGVRIVLDDAGMPSRPPRVSKIDAAAQRELSDLEKMRGALKELLDELPENRGTLRHLAFIEHAMDKKGARALYKVPLDVLKRAHEQIEAVVTNWSNEGLACLRSKMAVAIIDREVCDTNTEEDKYRTAAVLDAPLAHPEPMDEQTAAEAEEALLAAYGALAAGPMESSPETPEVPADPTRIELQGELGSPSAKALAKAAKAAGHGASKVEIELRELQS